MSFTSGNEDDQAETEIVRTAARCITYFADEMAANVDSDAVIKALKRDQAVTLSSVIELARKLNIDFAVSRVEFDDVARATEPVLVELVDGRFAVVLGTSGDEVTFYALPRLRPSSMPGAKFAKAWTGTIERCQSLEVQVAMPITLRTLVRHLMDFKGVVVSAAVTAIFVYAIELAFPLTFLVIIDSVIGTRAAATLDIVIVVLLVLTIFGAMLSNLSERVIRGLNQRLGVKLSTQFARHVLSLPAAFVSQVRGVEIASRLADLSQVHRLVT